MALFSRWTRSSRMTIGTCKRGTFAPRTTGCLLRARRPWAEQEDREGPAMPSSARLPFASRHSLPDGPPRGGAGANRYHKVS
jgi:hypothetical protein